MEFNTLWPSATIWWQRTGTTLAQIMACCLTAPSHLMNQCWLFIKCVLRHSPECNSTACTQVTIVYNEFGTYAFKLTGISPRGQWVDVDPHASYIQTQCLWAAFSPPSWPLQAPSSFLSSEYWDITTCGVPTSHVVCRQVLSPCRWLAVCSACETVTSERRCAVWHVSMVTCSPWIWVWTVPSSWPAMMQSKKHSSRTHRRYLGGLWTSLCLMKSPREKVHNALSLWEGEPTNNKETNGLPTSRPPFSNTVYLIDVTWYQCHAMRV